MPEVASCFRFFSELSSVSSNISGGAADVKVLESETVVLVLLPCVLVLLNVAIPAFVIFRRLDEIVVAPVTPGSDDLKANCCAKLNEDLSGVLPVIFRTQSVRSNPRSSRSTFEKALLYMASISDYNSFAQTCWQTHLTISPVKIISPFSALRALHYERFHSSFLHGTKIRSLHERVI